MPKGRPSKKSNLDLEKLTRLCAKGLTNEQLAEVYGVHINTIINWQASEDFLYALKSGKAKADQVVEYSLWQRATGYSHPEEKIFNNGGEIVRATTIKHYPPDPTSMIFWLKNRKTKEWREKHEVEHSGSLSITELMKDLCKPKNDTTNQPRNS